MNRGWGPHSPTLPKSHLTCTSPQGGLCGKVPGAGVGGVELLERAMRGSTEMASSQHTAWSVLSSLASPGCHPTYLPSVGAQVP